MIALAPGTILDEFGHPIQKPSRKVRRELVEAFAESNAVKLRERRRIEGKYDAAGSGTEYSNIWANADGLDADSANSHAVRTPLVRRSRYEIANNGYADGIATTYANDLVGLGPTLRMQTGSEGFNRMVEREWNAWTKAIHFRRKLWCMAHAKHSDGEALGVLRSNKRIRGRIKLDLVLHETEQCHTPYLPWNEPNRIDGIKFDDFGNPLWYEFLQHHPGSTNHIEYNATERVPAKFVAHWFKMRRPGQHRGVPECVSTLNLGAASRRFREATLAAAETAADFALMLHTMFEPDEMDAVSPMSTLDIQKRMMTALPAGYKAEQLKAEHPTSTYEMFAKTLIGEQARPKSMPLNKAACDSSSYNYASGRLDHQTYYGSLDVERADCDDLVLDPIFEVWFEVAVMTYGWLGGNPDSLNAVASKHAWDWPKHQVADIKSESSANETRLKNGSATLSGTYSEAGLDYEDQLVQQAASNGISVDEQRKINMLLNVPQHAIQYAAAIIGIEAPTAATAAPPQAPDDEEDDAEE